MRNDITGKKFGRLTALRFSHVDGRNSACWFFKCDCGTEKVIVGTWVVRGSVQSCGCLHNDFLKTKAFCGWNKLSEGESAFNVLYSNYGRAALRRNLEFSLTRGQFKLLTSSTCSYCGIEPLQISKVKKSSAYTYNGVDRKDNCLGYTKENCVACCKVCNLAKALCH